MTGLKRTIYRFLVGLLIFGLLPLSLSAQQINDEDVIVFEIIRPPMDSVDNIKEYEFEIITDKETNETVVIVYDDDGTPVKQELDDDALEDLGYIEDVRDLRYNQIVSIDILPDGTLILVYIDDDGITVRQEITPEDAVTLGFVRTPDDPVFEQIKNRGGGRLGRATPIQEIERDQIVRVDVRPDGDIVLVYIDESGQTVHQTITPDELVELGFIDSVDDPILNESKESGTSIGHPDTTEDINPEDVIGIDVRPDGSIVVVHEDSNGDTIRQEITPEQAVDLGVIDSVDDPILEIIIDKGGGMIGNTPDIEVIEPDEIIRVEVQPDGELVLVYPDDDGNEVVKRITREQAVELGVIDSVNDPLLEQMIEDGGGQIGQIDKTKPIHKDDVKYVDIRPDGDIILVYEDEQGNETKVRVTPEDLTEIGLIKDPTDPILDKIKQDGGGKLGGVTDVRDVTPDSVIRAEVSPEGEIVIVYENDLGETVYKTVTRAEAVQLGLIKDVNDPVIDFMKDQGGGHLGRVPDIRDVTDEQFVRVDVLPDGSVILVYKDKDDQEVYQTITRDEAIALGFVESEDELDSNTPGEISASQKGDRTSDGLPVPETATMIYNYLALGALLFVLGTGLYIKQRKGD